MMEKLTFGEPFLETRYFENETDYEISGSVLLVNPEAAGGESIRVNDDFDLAPMQVLCVKDTKITVPGKALTIKGIETLDLDDTQTLDCLRSVWNSNWQLTHSPESRGIPFYKSPVFTRGNLTMRFVFVSEPGFASGIHRTHPDPLCELHVQIAGSGFVDLMKSQDPDSTFASIPLTSGSVHMPTWDAEGIYPWHRYRSNTRSIFMVVEMR